MLSVNAKVRLLNLILLWFVYSSQAAFLMEENAINAAESESTLNSKIQIAPVNTDSNAETDSKLQITGKPHPAFTEAGNEVGEETAVAAAAAAEHMAMAIVAPLTHIAHITYDSVPVTHKPNDHKPLFHRESHDELIKL